MTIDVIVNDSSCLIDLRKGGLLTAALRLPFRFIVALPLVSAELQGFNEADWRDLRARGLEVINLDARRVGRALALKSQFPGLSAYDCFSLALAETTPGAMLLTAIGSFGFEPKPQGSSFMGCCGRPMRLKRTVLCPQGTLRML